MENTNKKNSFILWINLIRQFIVGEKKKIAILGIIGLIIFELFNVYLLVRITKWFGVFYNALQNLDEKAFNEQIIVFFIIAPIIILNSLLKAASKLWYSLEWRIWKTKKYLNSAWIKTLQSPQIVTYERNK